MYDTVSPVSSVQQEMHKSLGNFTSFLKLTAVIAADGENRR